MFGKRRVWATLLLVVLLLLTSTPFAVAQSPEICLPLINDENPTGTVVTTLGEFIQKAQPNDIYIVVMSADPVVAYTGQVAGLAATTPQAGNKIDPNSVQ